MYLHSNMVLLLRYSIIRFSSLHRIYIPIWCYFYRLGTQKSYLTNIIYIPIWCYFYSLDDKYASPTVQFTFQYGATSTFSPNIPYLLRIKFTFQYGATSTHFLNKIILLYSIFTFQYGATSTI